MNAPVRLRVLPALIPTDGREVEFQTTETYLQWRYTARYGVADTWKNLLLLEDITGPVGPAVEFQIAEDFIQYRPAGSMDEWADLIPLEEITGPQGIQGIQGDPGTVTDGDKGDVTVSGGGAVWEHNDESVSRPKATDWIHSVWKNVREFGAVGDGTADDTTACNNALAAGGITFVPEGVWRISNYLRLRQSTTLILDPKATIIRGDDANPRYMFLNVNYNDFSATAYTASGDICVQGGHLTWDIGTEGGVCFGICHADGFTFRNSKVSRWRTSHFADIAGCKNVLVREISASNWDNAAAEPLSSHDAVQIDYCSSTSFPAGGAPDDTVCEDVTVEYCRFDGVATGVGTHHSADFRHKRIRVLHNTLIGCLNDGIRARHWDDSLIFDNKVIGSDYRNLIVQQCARTIVSGNTFLDASLESSGFVSAVFFNNCQDCIFSDDNIVTATGTPLYSTALEIGSGGTPSLRTKVGTKGILKKGTVALVIDSGIDTEVNRSRRITLADDQATSVDMPLSGGTALMAISSTLASTTANPRGLVWVNADASPTVVNVSLTSTTNVGLTGGALTGTTGTDGNFTLSAHTDGKLYLENRTGGSRTFTIEFLAGI